MLQAPTSFDEYRLGWQQSLPTAEQRMLFDAEVSRSIKDTTTGVLFAAFLGGLGVHRFYLNDLWGIAYLVLCWTFVPAILALLEAFMMPARIDHYNRQQVYLIATRIKASYAVRA
jgi:TM2 domain-containing membrane protein YozV